jgi:hypothetical protein
LTEVPPTVGDHAALPLRSMVIITPPHILRFMMARVVGRAKNLAVGKQRDQHSRRPWLCRHVKPWGRIRENKSLTPGHFAHSRGCGSHLGRVVVVAERSLFSRCLALQVGVEERNGALKTLLARPSTGRTCLSQISHFLLFSN